MVDRITNKLVNKITPTQHDKLTHKIADNPYEDSYWVLDNNKINEIRDTYKIINVVWLDSRLVNSQILDDKYFNTSQKKTNIVNNMAHYYLTHKDKMVYQRTDYLCNEQEKLCICTIHAEELRQCYDKITNTQRQKYVSWIKLKTDILK
jgi:hypothetical protein